MNKSVSRRRAIIAHTREYGCDVIMMFPRLVQIGLKKYRDEPEHPRPAVRMMVRNALRLAVMHLGDKETARIVLETLSEQTLAEPVG